MSIAENLTDYMRVALYKFADVVLYIDTGTKYLHVDEREFSEFFGAPPSVAWAENGRLVSEDRIHPDDRIILSAWFTPQALSKTYKEVEKVEFRVLDLGGNEYFWTRCTIIPIDESLENNNTFIAPYKYVLCFKNVSNEKGKTMALLDAAKRDAYTDLFNKKHTQESVQKALSTNKRGALFLIDIDDFKSVNDRMGHLLGDVVILNTANRLKNLFGDECVLGRVGGDEFLGYLPECTKKDAEITAKLILETVNQITYGNEQKYNITCSIGVAIFPKDAKEYSALYDKADMASYVSKSCGKNKYNFYKSEISWDNVAYAQSREMQAIANTPLADSAGLLEYVFRILNDTSDAKSAIEQVMTTVAQKFEAQRTFYIRYLNNKVKLEYEWTQDDDISKVLEVLPRFEQDYYLKNYEGNGIYYRSDATTAHPESATILSRAGIKSFLHSAITEDSGVVGFIAFESRIVWGEEDFMLIGVVSKIITEFIKRSDSNNKIKEQSDRFKSVLNSMNKLVYTIDLNTYNLAYINDSMRMTFTHAAEGQKCYKILQKRDSECEDCPLKAMRGGQEAKYIYSITSSKCVRAHFRVMDMAGKPNKEALCWAEIIAKKMARKEIKINGGN